MFGYNVTVARIPILLRPENSLISVRARKKRMVKYIFGTCYLKTLFFSTSVSFFSTDILEF